MKIKLIVIRVILLAATGVVAMVSPTQTKYAALWLHYYLTGRGGKLLVPKKLVYEILPSLLWLGERTGQNSRLYYERTEIYFHNTTYYQGCGFEGRPALFYIIGCFTARVKQLNETKYSIYIKDVYDWHPQYRYKTTKEDTLYREYQEWMEEEEEEWCVIEKWYTSNFKFLSRFNNLLNFLLGDEYYPLEGYPDGYPGVSNKMWFDLQEVGAKPFTSIIKGVFELPYDEIDIK